MKRKKQQDLYPDLSEEMTSASDARNERRIYIDLMNSCWFCPPRRGENARWNYYRGWRSKPKYKK